MRIRIGTETINSLPPYTHLGIPNMSFTNPYFPLADIVIVHIFYFDDTIPPPVPDCDAEGGALV
jgi:hypothetical protein